MIKTEIKPKHLIILIQAYSSCTMSANGDLESASAAFDMFKYIRNKFTKQDMLEMHTWMEGVEKNNKIQMTNAMEAMNLKSNLEPLIKIVTH